MTTYDPAKLIAHYRAQAVRGLVSAAPDAEATLRQTKAHGNVTGAARASYRAYVVGEGAPDESATVSAALAAVNAKNPGAEALSDYTLPAGHLGVVLTGFTDYLTDLQTDNAGQKAALKPTLDAFAGRFVEAAAEGR